MAGINPYARRALRRPLTGGFVLPRVSAFQGARLRVLAERHDSFGLLGEDLECSSEDPLFMGSAGNWVSRLKAGRQRYRRRPG